ncbi:N-acetylmuramoyl-L-alanine amidase [bacterium]|nr:N-acetylmuramoyl-L-alanine amidase [bacterium]
MRRISNCIVVSLWIILYAQPLWAEKPKIHIVYPQENQVVHARDSTFIYGFVTSGSNLSINDYPVDVYVNGAFLAYLPILPGEFVFHCFSVLGGDTTMVERKVQIPYPLRPFPDDSLGFDTSYVYPRVSSILKPGDLFEVSVKGTPGCQAFFDIEGLAWSIPMTEQLSSYTVNVEDLIFSTLTVNATQMSGVYTGVYQIQLWDVVQEAQVRFHLVDHHADTVSIEAEGKLTVDHSPVPTIAVLTEETTVARPGPEQAYTWFLPEGVQVWITGKKGDWWRIHLGEGQEAWIPDGSFRLLPRGTPVPEAVVSVIRTRQLEDRVRIIIPLDVRVPFHIQQRIEPSSLVITLYGVWSDTDWIPQDISNPLIRDIRWTQMSNRVYTVEMTFNEAQQWGYDARYNGNTLEIDIKRKPDIAGWPGSPFKDIVICLDPGHRPDLGAVGPTGLAERDVNMGVALHLQEMLESKGAIVVMTREGSQGIDLRARSKLADVVNADILVSIHFNSVPDGTNPWKNNGSSTYYYHPMSRQLATLIHEEVLRELKLPDMGVYYADLALCRTTQMVAVLTEEAFMIIPQQEMLLVQPDYQKRCAKAILKGLENFLKENR